MVIRKSKRFQGKGTCCRPGLALGLEALESRVLLAADFEPDRFEVNDTIAMATTLGSVPAVTLRDLTIHSADDVDFFNYTANRTGLIVVNAFFEDDIGDIDLRVRDSLGNILASSETPSDDERLTLARYKRLILMGKIRLPLEEARRMGEVVRRSHGLSPAVIVVEPVAEE